MIVIDCGVFMKTAYAVRKLFEQQPEDEMRYNMIRHVILKNIIEWKIKFEKTYGSEIVLADDIKGGSWRKDIFKYYKANRKNNMTEMDKLFFSTIHDVKEEISNVFKHWNYIQVEKAEGDDIVGVMAKYVDDENKESLFANEKVLIISHDKDMRQLLGLKSVDLFDVNSRKIVKRDFDQFKIDITTHIVKGDSGDGIPNIYSDDNFLVESIRQRSVSAKMLEAYMKKGINAIPDFVDKADVERVKNNWERNCNLVLLDNIPKDIRYKVIDRYNENKLNTDKSMIQTYIVQNRLTQIYNLMQNI